jgi:hypothetical protein
MDQAGRHETDRRREAPSAPAGVTERLFHGYGALLPWASS